MGDDLPPHEGATSRVWYLQTAASSHGEVHEQRVESLLGSPFPPTHSHPDRDEHLEVELTGPSARLVPIVARVARLRGRRLPALH